MRWKGAVLYLMLILVLENGLVIHYLFELLDPKHSSNELKKRSCSW